MIGDIISQLVARRKALGLLQRDIAEQLFVARQTVVSWENRRNWPSREFLDAWAKALGVQQIVLILPGQIVCEAPQDHPLQDGGVFETPSRQHRLQAQRTRRQTSLPPTRSTAPEAPARLYRKHLDAAPAT
jgi:transcriptional regulator with XRE-family HTH domain